MIRILVDPVACDAYGYCAELLPEAISLDDGNIRSATFDSGMGFGLRAVAGEATGYAHSGEISEEALRRAAATGSRARFFTTVAIERTGWLSNADAR